MRRPSSPSERSRLQELAEIVFKGMGGLEELGFKSGLHDFVVEVRRGTPAKNSSRWFRVGQHSRNFARSNDPLRGSWLWVRKVNDRTGIPPLSAQELLDVFEFLAATS